MMQNIHPDATPAPAAHMLKLQSKTSCCCCCRNAPPQPPGLFKRMSDSFGYLTTKGYCSGKCLRWPVLMGEFSAPHAGTVSQSCGCFLATQTSC